MNIVTATVRELMDLDELVAAVGSNSTWPGGFIFAWDMQTDLEGTGQCAVTVMQDGNFAVPRHTHTMKYPKLRIEVWADPDRDASRNVAKKNAYDKAYFVMDIIDGFLHCPQGTQAAVWGGVDGVRVLSSCRVDEPFPLGIVKSDYIARVTTNYGVMTG